MLRELRRKGKGELVGALRVVVRAFDRGWYGFMEIERDEFSAVLTQCDALRGRVVEDK